MIPVDRQKALVIGFARTLVQCADSGDQVLTDCAFENLITSVETYTTLVLDSLSPQTTPHG